MRHKTKIRPRNEVAHSLRRENLATSGSCSDPGRQVHSNAAYIGPFDFDLARMHSALIFKAEGARLIGDTHSASHRPRRPVERCDEAIS